MNRFDNLLKLFKLCKEITTFLASLIAIISFIFKLTGIF